MGLSETLTVKAIMPPTTDWAIYKVSSERVKGFQLGDPVRRPKKICLQLFTGDAEFEINLSQTESGPPITQAELNRIIQTAHKAGHAEPTLSVSPA